MSRITTSSASLSWAMPAIRRACSSESNCPSAYPERRGVQPASFDLRPDGFGDEVVDRRARRNQPSNVARRDRNRLDVEELDPVRPAKLGQNWSSFSADSRAAWRRRGGRARGSRPARARSGTSRTVGADEEDRVLAEAGHGVDRVRVVVADDRVVREREPREVESSLDITSTRLCGGFDETCTRSGSMSKLRFAVSASST